MNCYDCTCISTLESLLVETTATRYSYELVHSERALTGEGLLAEAEQVNSSTVLCLKISTWGHRPWKLT